jgi:hypothetical protein
VEEGLSHNEIQLRLNLSPSTYFRYLDILFKAEQEAISGNAYTYQRLLNETLILNQRYLRRAKKLTATIGDNENVNAEQRIEAHKFAAQLERAAQVLGISGQSVSTLAFQDRYGRQDSNNNLNVFLQITHTKDEVTSLRGVQLGGDDIQVIINGIDKGIIVKTLEISRG